MCIRDCANVEDGGEEEAGGDDSAGKGAGGEEVFVKVFKIRITPAAFPPGITKNWRKTLQLALRARSTTVDTP